MTVDKFTEEARKLAEIIKKGNHVKNRDPVAYNLLQKHGIDLKKEKAKSIRSAKQQGKYPFSQLKTINDVRAELAKEKRFKNKDYSNLVSKSVEIAKRELKEERTTRVQDQSPLTLDARLNRARHEKKGYGMRFLTQREMNTLKYEPTKYSTPKIKKYYW